MRRAVWRYAMLLSWCLSMVSTDAMAATPRRWIDTLPSSSKVLDGYMADGIEEKLADQALSPVEDVWVLVSTGGLIAVERVSHAGADVGLLDCYQMVVLRAPDRAVRPGTVMGYMQPTAAQGTYEARIYTGSDGDGTLRDAKTFRVVVKEDAMLFYRVRSGLTVNIMRMLPYMVRRAVDYRPDDHNGLDGCVRYRETLPRYF